MSEVISIGFTIGETWERVGIRERDALLWSYRMPRQLMLQQLDAGHILTATQRQLNGDYWLLAKLSKAGAKKR